MLFFLYHKTTRPTGRVLAKALGFQHFGLRLKQQPPDFLVRWGNAAPANIREGREINKASAIVRSSNKLSAFKAMQEANVQIPWFSTSQAEAQALVHQGQTVFGRTRTGSKGRGIVVYSPDVNGGNVGYHELYTEFIPNSREYRLHVVGAKVVRFQRKYPTQDNAGAFIKNHAAGFVFKQPSRPLNKSRESLAIAAVASLGLDFGAVDLVIDAQGVAHVLEVNTAPACSPLTGRAYVSALVALIAERSGGDYAHEGRFGELTALGNGGEAPDPRAVILNGA